MPPESYPTFKNPGQTFNKEVEGGTVYSFPEEKLRDSDMRAMHAIISISGGKSQVAYGVDPTPSFGHPIVNNREIELNGYHMISDFRITPQDPVGNIQLSITLFYN